MKTFKSFVTEAEDTVTKDKSGKVVSWEHKGVAEGSRKNTGEPKGREELYQYHLDAAKISEGKAKEHHLQQAEKYKKQGVAEEVEPIEESYTLKLTKTTKPHTTDDEDNPVPAIEKHYDIHHKGKKVGKITHHYNEYGGHFFDANLHGKRVPYDRHPGKEQNAKAFIAGISKTKWHSKNIKEEVDRIDEVAAWQRSEGKNPEGGLNKKGIQSYRREHPGSKLSLAVTTKPSKLKKGSKAAKRRKSFCARMSGMKKRLTSAKTAHDPDSRINKSLRKWNC